MNESRKSWPSRWTCSFVHRRLGAGRGRDCPWRTHRPRQAWPSLVQMRTSSLSDLRVRRDVASKGRRPLHGEPSQVTWKSSPLFDGQAVRRGGGALQGAAGPLCLATVHEEPAVGAASCRRRPALEPASALHAAAARARSLWPAVHSAPHGASSRANQRRSRTTASGAAPSPRRSLTPRPPLRRERRSRDASMASAPRHRRDTVTTQARRAPPSSSRPLPGPRRRRRRWLCRPTRLIRGEKSAKGAWRSGVSLLFATRSDGNTDPVSLSTGPQLGQRTIAETASWTWRLRRVWRCEAGAL